MLLCILALRSLEYALGVGEPGTGEAGGEALHYPLTGWLGAGLRRGVHRRAGDRDRRDRGRQDPHLDGVGDHRLGLQPAMGVAWHRFLAFVNIWAKRHPAGRTSLGALQPMMVDGEPLDFEKLDDLDEDAALGVGKVEDFTWKGLLDFSTCTECGRCQSQCPAWNTEKPLSPKLLIMALRDHAHGKAPWLLAGRTSARSCPWRPGPRASGRWWRRSARPSRPGWRSPACTGRTTCWPPWPAG